MQRHVLALVLAVTGCASEIATPTDTDPTSASDDTNTGLPADDLGTGVASMSATSGVTIDPGATSGSTMTGDEASTSSDETGPACRADIDCTDGAFPFCAGGTCAACSGTDDPNAACLRTDSRAPICLDGECVGCPPSETFCPAAAPSCRCQACNAHDQCAGGAGCAILTGECLPTTAVYYVDDVGPCPGDGSELAPFCSIQDAVDAIGPGLPGTVRIAPTDGIGYGQAVTVDSGRTVALLGSGTTIPVLLPSPGRSSSILTVAGGDTVVYLDRLRLRTSDDAPAVAIGAATLYGTRVEIVQNSAGGVTVSTGAELWLLNSMIGSAYPDSTSVSVTDSTAHILYSTVIGGELAPALACGVLGSADVRNSILLSSNATPEIECDAATIMTSATEAEVGSFNGTQPWFQSFAAGNYHLTPDGAAVFADLAQWQTGDPVADVDGDPRPTVAGDPDVPGADVPAP